MINQEKDEKTEYSYKIYLEHRVFVRVNQNASLILSEMKEKITKIFPEIINYEQERLFVQIKPEEIEENVKKGYVVGEIDEKPTLILTRYTYELPTNGFVQSVESLELLKRANLLRDFAVIESIESKFTNILGV